MAGAEFGGGLGTQYLNTSSPVEDVSDMLFQITPEDTPFMSSIRQDGVVRDVIHSWQQRNLTLRQDNAAVEGFSFAFTTAQRLPSRLSNFTQIFENNGSISGTQQAIDHYAIDDRFQDEMDAAMAEHETSIEHASIQGTAASGTTDTAPRLNGMRNFLIANSAATDFTATVSLTETRFNDAIQKGWEDGAKFSDAYVGGKLKRRISSFTAQATQFIDVTQQRTVNTISMYESDFFPVSIHLSRDIPVDTIHAGGYSGMGLMLTDLTMVRWAWLRRSTMRRAPETGDHLDGYIVGEGTLEVGHPSGHRWLDKLL